MTETPTKIIVDCSTGEQAIVPLTADELAQREADAVAYATAEAERQAETDRIEALKASARSKLVSGTALTAEEAALLVL